MYYDCPNKSHKIAIIVPIILAILSPHGFVEADKSQESKTYIYQTGSEVKKTSSSSGTIQKPKETREEVEKSKCDTQCKIETLIKLGITSNLANLIVSECKEGALDPVHCIIVASAIIINESGGGKSNACKTRYNCMGIGSGKVAYTSYQEAVANFVSKYNRYWYKAQSASFFYATSGNIPPSKYCMSEDSSDNSLGCPNGQRIVQNVWNKLDILF